MKSVSALSIVWYVLGGLNLMVALLMGVLFGGGGIAIGVASGGDEDAAIAGGVIALFGVVFGVFVAVMSIPSLLTGWGLANRKGWARVLAMILGAFQVLSFPIGTLIGVWTIWLLMQPDVEREFATGRPGA